MALTTALFASGTIARAVPVAASVVLHASLAAGLLAGAVGHASAGVTTVTSQAIETVETPVDVAEEQPAAPETRAETRAETKDETKPASAVPSHTHPYPVDPSHDAHPHDAALHHEEAAPAQAAPAMTTEAPAALPHFTLPSGGGAPGASHVVASGAPSSASGTDVHATGAGAGEEAIVPAASVQVPAKLVQSVAAAYPIDARADDVEGDVEVEIVVDRDGRVATARVLRAAGHGFDEAAIAAVKRYRFSPAQREGKLVRVRMPWSVQFRLR